MKGIEELRSILKNILPAYQCISEVNENNQNDWFKSIDSIAGDVFLIKHTNAWEWIYKNSDGTRNYDKEDNNIFNTRIRPTPILKMKYEEARKLASGDIAKTRTKKVNAENW
jgi:hypothetical protein